MFAPVTLGGLRNLLYIHSHTCNHFCPLTHFYGTLQAEVTIDTAHFPPKYIMMMCHKMYIKQDQRIFSVTMTLYVRL